MKRTLDLSGDGEQGDNEQADEEGLTWVDELKVLALSSFPASD